MRIVNLQTFISLPVGTLFSKYAPCYFEALSIKGESIPDTSDFYYQQIDGAIDCTGSSDFGYKLELARIDPSISLQMDLNTEGRDGCFDKDQLFAVWERQDVVQLITRLQETLK